MSAQTTQSNDVAQAIREQTQAQISTYQSYQANQQIQDFGKLQPLPGAGLKPYAGLQTVPLGEDINPRERLSNMRPLYPNTHTTSYGRLWRLQKPRVLLLPEITVVPLLG